MAESEPIVMAETAVNREDPKIAALLASAEKLTIGTAVELETTSIMLSEIKGRQKGLTDLRLSITKPMDAAKKRVMEVFQPAVDRLGKAERTLKSLDPPDAGIRFARARLHYLQGQYRATLGETAVLTALPEPPWEAVYLAAAALGRLGRAAEALELARPYLDREEGRGAFHRLAGELLQSSGDAAASQRTYEAGLRLYPRDSALIEGVTRLAISREDWRTARNWLEAGVERPSPYLPGFLERLERVYRRIGERDKAEEALARYLAVMDPLLREPGEVPDQAILFRMSLPPMRLGSGTPVRARDTAGAQEASPDPSASSNPNASNPSR